MLKNLIVKRGALVLLLVGMVVGAAGAQIAQNLYRSRYITTGLFTLESKGQARFHVSLDDRGNATDAQVIMRIYNQSGQVVKRQVVTLAPGQSSTLTFDNTLDAEATFRGQAEVFESALTLSDRRIVLASMETYDPVQLPTGELDLLYRGTVCHPGESIPAPVD